MYSTVQMCLWLTNRRKCFIFGGPSQTNTISAALSFALLCLSSFITVLTSSSSLTLSAKIFSFFSPPPPPSHSLQCPPPPPSPSALPSSQHLINICLGFTPCQLAGICTHANQHTHTRAFAQCQVQEHSRPKKKAPNFPDPSFNCIYIPLRECGCALAHSREDERQSVSTLLKDNKPHFPCWAA